MLRLTVLSCVAAAMLPVQLAFGDGGTLRVSQESDGCRVSVFTSPAPLREGPIDVSVFVQDVRTGKPLLDSDVQIQLWHIARPEKKLQFACTNESATNKIFQSAKFELPQAGKWHLEVSVNGQSRATCEMEAFEPPPRWLDLIGWIVWPIVPIVLFVLYRILVNQRKRAAM